MVNRYNILDTSVLLGAASSVVDSGRNREYEVLYSITNSDTEIFITCAEQKEEFSRNLQADRFKKKEQINPVVFEDIRSKLDEAISLSVNTDVHRNRYGKDAFVPALVDSSESKCVRVISRDKDQLKKIRADYPEVEIVDLNQND